MLWSNLMTVLALCSSLVGDMISILSDLMEAVRNLLDLPLVTCSDLITPLVLTVSLDNLFFNS